MNEMTLGKDRLARDLRVVALFMGCRNYRYWRLGRAFVRGHPGNHNPDVEIYLMGTFDEEPEGQFLEIVKFALAVVAAFDHRSTDVTEVFVLTTIYPADLRRGPGLRVSPRGRGRGIPDWGSGRAFI